MAHLGDHIRTLDVPEPMVMPTITPIPVTAPVEETQRELVPVRRKGA